MHVDNIILIGSPNAPLDYLLSSLAHEFAIKDLGRLHYVLGIEVHCVQDSLVFTQFKYFSNLFKKTRMDVSKSIINLIPSSSNLSLHVGDLYPYPSHYRSIIRALQYLSQPNIACDVNYVCQFMHMPTTGKLLNKFFGT